MEWILPNQTIEDPIEWIYSSRGIKDKSNSYFNPTAEDLYSALLLSDVAKFAKVIESYIGTDKKIFIHGDFDVDGITATSIMWQFLARDLKLNVTPYIPSRFTEGYGLSKASIEYIIEQGAELIITVDCGIKDIDLVAQYSDRVDFVITDHHTPLVADLNLAQNANSKIENDFLVSAKSIANCHPKLGNYPFSEICGAAVSWKSCCAINSILNLGIDMSKYLDLVAIGTVCDIMPLIDENRVFIKLGLDLIHRNNNLGISKLLEYLNISSSVVDTYHLGFVIGPRINASGRLEDAMEGVRLLSTENAENALKIAIKLDLLNQERQKLTATYLEIAETQIEAQKEDKVYFVYGDDWHEGIVGLIAGKLTEKYNRPVIAASKKEGKLKGSARSIESFNIATNLSLLSSLLTAHGGHAQAAGLSLEERNLTEFVAQIKENAKNSITEENLLKKLRIDALGNLDLVSIDNFNKINRLAPFGMGNRKPLIAFLNCSINQIKIFGQDNKHFKIMLKGSTNLVEATAFFKADLLDSLNQKNRLDIAGTLEKNDWNGRENTFIRIEHIRQSNS